MKKWTSFLVIVLALSVFISAKAEEAEEGGGNKDRVGPNKAVLAANEKEGIKLSAKSVKNFALGFKEINLLGQISVPLSALVQFQDFTAVYRERIGWFKMVEIEPQISGQTASFSSKDFKPGDRLVIANGGLIRVVELDIFGPEADACAD